MMEQFEHSVKTLECLGLDSIKELDPDKTYVLQFKHDLTADQYARVKALVEQQWPGIDVKVLGHQVRLYESVDEQE